MNSLYARSFPRSIISSTSEWTAKQSVFLRIQVRSSSQTKGLGRGWKQRARLGRDARRACETRALRARKTLTPRFTYFFTDFEKKPTVLQSTSERLYMTYALHLEPKLANTRLIPGDEYAWNHLNFTHTSFLLCVYFINFYVSSAKLLLRDFVPLINYSGCSF